jgi:hypothetical protein
MLLKQVPAALSIITSTSLSHESPPAGCPARPLARSGIETPRSRPQHHRDGWHFRALAPVTAFLPVWSYALPAAVPPATHGRPMDCLAQRACSVKSLYSPHSPGLACLNHRADLHGTGNHPGYARPSRVRPAHQPDTHVAQRDRPSFHPHAQHPLPRRHVHRHHARLSPPRNQKLVGTPMRRCFAIRLRLRQVLPASPFGPLIVELFTVAGLPRSPSVVIRPSSHVTVRALPTPAKVAGA